MYKEIKLQRAGGSTSANLPKAMLERHHLDTGDRAFVVDTEDGILITPYDPTFARAMEIAERGAKKYRNALRELAK
jgi:putative addiction module antidote